MATSAQEALRTPGLGPIPIDIVLDDRKLRFLLQRRKLTLVSPERPGGIIDGAFIRGGRDIASFHRGFSL